LSARTTPRGAAGALLSALALAAGCSVIVPSELDDVRCSDEGAIGPPACEPGQVCGAGRCVGCMASEACGDQVDNDCDGVTEDGCSDGGGATGGSGGTGGAGGSAGAPTGADLGEPCDPGDQCAAGLFCGVAGLAGPRLCTKGCCGSDECDAPGLVCFPSAGGAPLCWPASAAGRAKPGVKPVGSDCAAPGECRSGWCDSGTCADSCCHASDCAGAAPDCTFRNIGGAAYSGFSCGRGPGASAYQDVCFGGDSDCRSGVCTSSGFPTCSQACCSTSDCGTLLECTYAQKNGSMIRLCFGTGHEGNLEIGEACSADAECRSGWCLSPPSGASICTDACCRDVDCQDVLRFACRLGPRGSDSVLRCEAR
jgi:hypothetical protein